LTLPWQTIGLADSGRHPATVSLPASRYPALPDAAQKAELALMMTTNREAQIREMLLKNFSRL